MNATYATYRWEFRNDIRMRTYAEAELEELGRPGDKGYFMKVYLMRDAMVQPTEQNPIADPENRVGVRVYVGGKRSREDDRVKHLAYMAPVVGHELAYTLIYEVLKENLDAVERYGDDWLTELFREVQPKPKRIVKKAPKRKKPA